MNPLYWLKQPSAPANPPRRWSYSALALWRACPRRWWLLNSRYENAPGGTYPTVFGAAAVHGRLVHAALEAERNRGDSADNSFQPRRFLKQALRDLFDGEVAQNPRLDRGRLEAAVSIDDCLAKFFAISQGVPTRPRVPPPGEVGRTSGPPREAQEYWLEVEDPPLAGRIDQVRSGTLVDFKTGDEDLVAHGEQLRLYAALWWLRFGEPPAGLEVRYPRTVHQLPTPGQVDLLRTAEALRTELSAITHALAMPPPPAYPGAETCKQCPVRQLCSEYWVAPETRPLRTLTVLGHGSAASPPFRDVELSCLPENWVPGNPLAGVARGNGIGFVSVNLPRKLCPDEGSPLPSGARLLQALLLSRDDELEVRITNTTEVFWK